MLVRISSAAGGIKEYLETGRKKGREFDRELIDDRLVLAGDLDITDAVIDSIETTQPGASRYLHITLGFAERFTTATECGPNEINYAKLHEVADAYREMLMQAYDPEEYSWYAEAHVPKVSHDLHASTGEAIERLPHIHIVLPMRNLVNGKHLNPAGFSKHTLKFEQAMQEVLNQRFGLKSPLDAQRSAPINPLGKHNAAFEERSPKQIRAELAQQIQGGDIDSFEKLIDAAAAYGEVRIRQGRDGDYINVKPAWASKGINLKDFTRQDFGADGVAKGRAKPDAPDFDKLLADWTDKVAYEARFVNSANRAHYKALDSEAKDSWIAARVGKAAAALQKECGDVPLIFNKDPHGPSPEDRARLVAVSVLQRRFDETRRRSQPESLASVRHLSSVDMAQHAQVFELLLHPHAPDDLGAQGGAGDAVRREGNGDSRDAGADGGITYLSTLRKQRQAGVGLTPDQLKNETSPTLVLEAAAKQFGLDKSKYDITSARDGTPRIRHEDKHYNLGDFFTKHLDVPWADAKVILERCYNDTMADALPPPDKDLWRSFGTWRNERFAQATQGKEQARVDLSGAILDARDTYKAIRLRGKGVPALKRQALMAEARAEQLMKIEAAREKSRQAKVQFAAPSRNAMYRTFLTELANAGNLNALGELRRMSKPEADMTNTLTGRTSRPVFPQPSYRVDHTGKVTYFQDGKAVVTDSVKGVSVIEAARNSHALAIKVAVARYGPNLTLNGDALFVKQMVEAARASGMNLTIRDASRPTAPPIRTGPEINR